MDFWEVIKERRSVRRFSSEEVPAETIERILEAAISAPSAGNCQPWYFLVVRRPEVKRLLAEAAYGQHFVAEAPVVIVVCAEPGRSGMRYGRRGTELYCLQDTAAAAENILLAAVASGLGACWVGAFDEAAAAKAVNLPEGMRPVSIIPIGRPAHETARRTGRRPLREVSRWID